MVFAVVWNACALAADASFGIVVGTGSTAVADTQFALATKIAQGTATGQLVHGACTLVGITSVGNVTTMSFTRQVTNNSAAPITIQEVAMYVKSTYDGFVFMICRDVVAPQALQPGDSLPIYINIVVTA